MMTRRAAGTSALIGMIAATAGAILAVLMGDRLPPPVAGGVLALIGVTITFAVLRWRSRANTATIRQAMDSLDTLRERLRAARPGLFDTQPGSPTRSSTPRPHRPRSA